MAEELLKSTHKGTGLKVKTSDFMRVFTDVFKLRVPKYVHESRRRGVKQDLSEEVSANELSERLSGRHVHSKVTARIFFLSNNVQEATHLLMMALRGQQIKSNSLISSLPLSQPFSTQSNV